MAERRRSVRVGDAEVSYAVHGAGPGLVLVHGTGGSGETNFGHLVGSFTAGWTVVRPDYAGSGETTDGDGPLELEDLVAQVAGAAADAGAIPFDLVGFSLGAAVAAQLAASRPELVRSLVLLGGFVSTVGDARSHVQFELWRRIADADPDLFSRIALLTGMSPAFLATLTPAAAEEAIALGVRTRQPGTARQAELDLRVDLTEQLPQIAARTLVIGQTRDHMVPVEHARALHAAIPGADYVELDTGHLGLLEQPDLVVRTIREFLLRDA